jgi:hypothetical protein
MFARMLAGIALVLLPSLAFAGLPITEFREPKTTPWKDLGPDGLPIPEHAAARSARSTIVMVGVGTALCGIGASGSVNNSDYGAAPGLFIVGAGLASLGLVVGPSAGYS